MSGFPELGIKRNIEEMEQPTLTADDAAEEQDIISLPDVLVGVVEEADVKPEDDTQAAHVVVEESGQTEYVADQRAQENETGLHDEEDTPTRENWRKLKERCRALEAQLGKTESENAVLAQELHHVMIRVANLKEHLTRAVGDAMYAVSPVHMPTFAGNDHKRMRF